MLRHITAARGVRNDVIARVIINDPRYWTDRAEMDVHAPREIGVDRLDFKLTHGVVSNFLLPGQGSAIQLATQEFFDQLAFDADILLEEGPGPW